jgi:hypothetical protein
MFFLFMFFRQTPPVSYILGLRPILEGPRAAAEPEVPVERIILDLRRRAERMSKMASIFVALLVVSLVGGLTMFVFAERIATLVSLQHEDFMVQSAKDIVGRSQERQVRISEFIGSVDRVLSRIRDENLSIIDNSVENLRKIREHPLSSVETSVLDKPLLLQLDGLHRSISTLSESLRYIKNSFESGGNFDRRSFIEEMNIQISEEKKLAKMLGDLSVRSPAQSAIPEQKGDGTSLFGTILTRFGSLVILFVCIQVFGRLYRYNTSMAAEYNSLADGLIACGIFSKANPTPENLMKYSKALKPTNIELPDVKSLLDYVSAIRGARGTTDK